MGIVCLEVNAYCTRGQYGHTVLGVNMDIGRLEVNTYCTRGQYGHGGLDVNT
jgi:hypothetical protein